MESITSLNMESITSLETEDSLTAQRETLFRKSKISLEQKASLEGRDLMMRNLQKRIKEAFDVFDHAENQTVDVREVGTVLRSLGCVPTEAEIQEIILTLEDQETSAGNVHLDKFLPHVSNLICEYKICETYIKLYSSLRGGEYSGWKNMLEIWMQPASAEELLKAFQTMDKENKGYLTREFLEKAMTEEGEPFTKDEIDEMMTVAVDPDSGHINYEYYINQIMVSVQPDIYSLVPPPEEKKKPRELGLGLL